MAQTDRDALVALYRATGGARWLLRRNWDTVADFTTWHGVRVNDQGRVMILDLSYNDLQGPIPKALGALSMLETLWLCENNFTGPIPPELGNLAALKNLNLAGNQISGRIPKELGALRQLQLLSLHNNQLTGPIPEALGALDKLKELWLRDNNLTGSIPPDLRNLAALEFLVLSNNRLGGSIPKDLGALANLTTLNLSNNQFTGPIPKELGALSELKALALSGNQLTGPIPPKLGNLGALQHLGLEDNQLSGHIPKDLGALRKLRVLSLGSNQLTGPILPELATLEALQHLALEVNRLTGRIPKDLGNLRHLTELDLRNNQLRGPIPRTLQRHQCFGNFTTGLALDGPPLPAVRDRLHAIRVLIVPVVLGYADLASDLFTALSYYKTHHLVWFGLGLFFALGPAVIVSVFFLRSVGWFRRFLVATQLSLLAEAWRIADRREYSPVLALVRVVEPLFESVPQLLLQLYTMLRLWPETSSSFSRLAWRVVSVCISVGSLAYAATDVSSVERLLTCGGEADGERFGFRPWCPSLTGVVFSRVPADGFSRLRGSGKMHPRSHVWLCFLYHILEIVARFVPLAMLVLVIDRWFVCVLVYLWISRGSMVWMTAREDLGFRFRVRLVAMPFLDSIMDERTAFRRGLVLTLVEFVVCLVVYHVYKHDSLPARARLVLISVANSCMVGKMCLAWVAISPLKVDVDNSKKSVGGGIVRGERGSAVTDGAVVGLEMSALEGGNVEGGVEVTVASESASSKGAQLPPDIFAVSTSSVLYRPGDVKVEDETGSAVSVDFEEKV